MAHCIQSIPSNSTYIMCPPSQRFPHWCAKLRRFFRGWFNQPSSDTGWVTAYFFNFCHVTQWRIPSHVALPSLLIFFSRIWCKWRSSVGLARASTSGTKCVTTGRDTRPALWNKACDIRMYSLVTMWPSSTQTSSPSQSFYGAPSPSSCTTKSSHLCRPDGNSVNPSPHPCFYVHNLALVHKLQFEWLTQASPPVSPTNRVDEKFINHNKILIWFTGSHYFI